MSSTFLIGSLISLTAFAPFAWADGPGIAKPNLVLDEAVSKLPKADTDEVRVLTATLDPGDKTPAHTHRFPVIAYVLEGSFTLERKDMPTLTVNAGHAFVEAPGVETTGYNRSPDKATKVVIFYVSAPNTPFLDPVK